MPVVFYTAVPGMHAQKDCERFNYVRLPANVETMARVLKNLFIDDEILIEPVTGP